MSAGGRRSDESRGQDGFAHIGIGTKYLVYSKVFEEERHSSKKQDCRKAQLAHGL